MIVVNFMMLVSWRSGPRKLLQRTTKVIRSQGAISKQSNESVDPRSHEEAKVTSAQHCQKKSRRKTFVDAKKR